MLISVYLRVLMVQKALISGRVYCDVRWTKNKRLLQKKRLMCTCQRLLIWGSLQRLSGSLHG